MGQDGLPVTSGWLVMPRLPLALWFGAPVGFGELPWLRSNFPFPKRQHLIWGYPSLHPTSALATPHTQCTVGLVSIRSLEKIGRNSLKWFECQLCRKLRCLART